MAAEAREGARVEARAAPPSQKPPERLDRGLDRGQLVVVEPAQVLLEPRRAPGAHASQQPLALVGQRQADAAAVFGVARALDQPCLLEPVDVAGESRRRDPLLGSELAQAQRRG